MDEVSGYGESDSDTHADCSRDSHHALSDNVPDIPSSIATRIDGEKSSSFAS